MVIVVPIFAPMIIGTAFVILSAPPETIATTMAVVAEELWIIEVARRPIMRPVNGFEVVLIRSSAKPFPRSLKESPMRLMATKKR